MYLQRSKGMLLNLKDCFGTPYLNLIFECLAKLESNGLSSHEDIELIVLIKLLTFLIENCYEELTTVQGVLDEIYRYLFKFLFIENRGNLILINSLQLMCIMLFRNSQDFVQLGIKHNNGDKSFFKLFGSLELFDDFNQRGDLLLGIIGFFKLSQDQFPNMIPMSSLVREAFNCVSVIIQSNLESSQALKGNSNSHSQNNEGNFEEDLLLDDDEDDDDWNEEDYFREEIEYEYESPLEDVDPVLEFENVLNKLHTDNKNYFRTIFGELSPSERTKLKELFEVAKELSLKKSHSQ